MGAGIFLFFFLLTYGIETGNWLMFSIFFIIHGFIWGMYYWATYDQDTSWFDIFRNDETPYDSAQNSH